jgi:hypothetical protein
VSPKKVFIVITVFYLLGFFAHALYLHKTVYGDGIYYFSWVRSIIVDHKITFTGNKYTVGPPILWSPGFVWTNSIVRSTGYEFPYQLAVGVSSVLYCLFALILLYRLLNIYFSRETALASIVGTAGATNLFFYGSLDSVNSHAVSFFASVLFLTFLFQKSKNWFLIGCSLGLVALIRTQDIILGLLVIPYLPKKQFFLLFLGALLLFLPQLTAWQLLYGKFWTSPYLGGKEGFNFLQPHLFGVLFSLQNGLIIWTPIVLLGFIGLWMKRGKIPLKLIALIVLLQLYLVASWSTWWQGASYSGRMFVSILPLIAFGLANVFSYLQHRKFRGLPFYLSIVLPLTLINLLLMIFFLWKLK